MLTDYQTLVMNLARDDGGKVSNLQRDEAIDLAVKRYSQDRPREKVEDITPATANLLPLPDAWEADFSALVALEHPIGDHPPSWIPAEKTEFYRSPSALQIRVIIGVTVGADSVRATYTIKHTVTALEDTIPVHHREPVACWAAAMLCDQLATFYSAGTDSSIQADSVEQRSKAQEYSSRAKTLRKRYLDELGIEDKRGQPAGAIAELRRPDSWGGERLLHPVPPR